MFTATLLAVLLVYIKEETTEARKLVYGLVLANAGLTLVALIVSEHLRIPGSAVPAGLSTSSLQSNAWVAAVGTTLLLLDVDRHHPRLRVREPLRAAALRARVPGAAAGRVVRQRVVHAAGAGADQPAAASRCCSPGSSARRRRRCFYTRRAVPLPAVLRAAAGHGRQRRRAGRVPDADLPAALRGGARSAWCATRSPASTTAATSTRSLPRAVAHAARYQEPLSVLLVDTDHFKTINDTHSHLIGDRVLRLVAETLGEHARAADTVCRYGGDEFIVILSAADSERRQRLRRALPPPPARAGRRGGAAAADGRSDGHGGHRHLPRGSR